MGEETARRGSATSHVPKLVALLMSQKQTAAS